MYKNISFLILSMIILFSISCQRQKQSIEEDYLREIESEYTPPESVKTNYENTIEADTAITNRVSPATRRVTPTTNRVSPATSRVSPATRRVTPATRRVTPATSRVSPATRRVTPIIPYTPTPIRKATKYTINNFDTAWTSKNDPNIIKELRVMIANREYEKARVYIDKLDFNNIPANIDLGNLYQFKGIVYYFLVPSNAIALAASEESFKQVVALTKIEKFKPLSLLWNAMLYQKYSNDEVKLNEAIALLDRIITEYPRTRFVNDAVYYKALTLKKLGRPESEYSPLLNSIKTGEYIDDLIFSQGVNGYVKSSVLVK